MRKIVIGNWKMNPTSLKEVKKLYSTIALGLKKVTNTDVVACPPYVYLSSLRASKKIALGVQNIFYEESGAFTGEVSPLMLSDFVVKYVILGHSERRALGETNSDINKKIKTALVHGLTPVLCVGESVRGEDHQYLGLVKNQIEEGLNSISKNLVTKVVVAYEPVWAIGKNALRSATAEEYREMVIFIKKVLSDKFGINIVEGMRIIYGGSAHPENIHEFLEVGGADGFLVGRDSLDPKKFLEIINICEASKN